MADYLLLEDGFKIILEDGSGDLLLDGGLQNVALTDSLPLSEAVTFQTNVVLSDFLDLDDSSPLVSGSTFAAALTDSLPLAETLQRAVSDCDRVRTSSTFGQARLAPTSWTWSETLLAAGRMAPTPEYCVVAATETQANTDALSLSEALDVALNHPTFTVTTSGSEAWFTGFEENNLALLGLDTAGAASIVTTPVHPGNGTYACELLTTASTAATIAAQLGTISLGTAPIYTRFYMNLGSVPGHIMTVWRAIDATSNHYGVYLGVDTSLHLRYKKDPNISGSGAHTFSTTLSLATWYRVEISWLSTTSFTIDLYNQDDTTPIESYTDSTTNNLNADIDNYILGDGTFFDATLASSLLYVDDWSIGRDSATLGPATTVLLPIVAAVSTSWTPHGFATNLECINDDPSTPDDDTGYLTPPGSTGTWNERYTIDSSSVPDNANVNRMLVGVRAKDPSGVGRGIFCALWKPSGSRLIGPGYQPQSGSYHDIVSSLTSRYLVLITTGLLGSQVSLLNVGFAPNGAQTSDQARVTTLFANAEYTIA